MVKKKWSPKDGWHHVPGYCVYVRGGLVEKYYAENDMDVTILVPEHGPVKWNTFRARMAQERKRTAAEV